MNAKNVERLFNVHEDADFEAKTIAYVQTAMKKNISEAQTIEVIGKVWKKIEEESSATNKEIQRLTKKLSTKGVSKQVRFRKKVEKFVKHFPEMNLMYEYRQTPENIQLTIDIICFMKQAFTHSTYLSHEVLITCMCNTLSQTREDPENYPRSFIAEYVNHIFEQVRLLTFKREKTWDGSTSLLEPHNIDFSFFPTSNDDRMIDVDDFTSVKYISDTAIRRQNYQFPSCSDTDNIIYTTWVIETFF